MYAWNENIQRDAQGQRQEDDTAVPILTAIEHEPEPLLIDFGKQHREAEYHSHGSLTIDLILIKN